MHLGGAILIVAALVAAETASAIPPVAWALRASVVAAGGLMVVFAAAAISGLITNEIRLNPGGVRGSLRGYSRLRRLHSAIWIAASLTTVLVVQWPQWVEHQLRQQVILFDELMVLLPLVMPMFFSHAAFFDVDRAAAGALGRSSHGAVHGNRWSYAWWFVRHEFGLVLMPLMLLFTARDVAEFSMGSSSPLSVWLPATVAIVAVVVGFPVLLRWVWPCEPVQDAALHATVQEGCSALGLAAPRLFKWNTGGRVVNAVVTGMLPRSHSVLMSDALLAHFSRDEIVAIVRHEAAHVQGHHILLRVAAMAAPLVACHAAAGQEAIAGAYHSLAALRPAMGDMALLAAIGLGMAAYFRWIFGNFSRQLELEADLVGCLAAAEFEAPCTALYKLGCVYGLDRRSWLHPTIRLRLRILRAARRRAAFADRILARSRRWKQAVGAGFAVAAVVALLA